MKRLRFTSGIATVARELVIGTAHHFNYVCVGGAMNHPEKGKRFDLSQSTNEVTGLTDSSVILYPVDGYGTQDLIRQMIEFEKPDAIVFITDPRYYVWLFQMEHEIRKKIPMIYLAIWDCSPSPLYNKEFYKSCDTILGISKQSNNLHRVALDFDNWKNTDLKYVPHGINEKNFYPINQLDPKYPELLEFQKNLFKGKTYDFVLLFNSRNIRRKSAPDLMLAFKKFLDTLSKEKADKCVLVMHTQPIDDNGTDLFSVRELIFGDETPNIIFSDTRGDLNYMNFLYNSCHGNALISSNEGWGLSLTEAMMCGKPIIANVTGGMQDQMRFEDEDGNWIDFDDTFMSNHDGKYKKHGIWAFPVFPSNMSLQGSVQTPYIFDDRCDYRDVAKVIEELYDIKMNQPDFYDMMCKEARKWVTSDESMMSARWMCENYIREFDFTIDNFKPRKRYDIIKIEKRKPKHLKFLM